MRLFSEEVKITSSNSPLNILQVKDFQEVFFGVFEVQINENKYVAEKISEENGNPIVSILVEEGNEKAQYPFLLLKGKQEIYFNSESEPVEIFESNIENEEDEDLEVKELIEETFDNSEIVEDKKQEILEEIKRVKRNAVKKSLEILEHNKAKNIQDIKNESRKKEKALKEYLESARENLVDEFTIISGKIKNELISDNDYKFDEIRDSIDLKIQDIADNLNESLGKNFQNSSKLIDKSVKKLVKELYESNINPKVDKELKNIAEEIVEKVSEIDKNLNNKLDEKADVSLIEGVNKELDAIRDANIELNNSLNKGIQKALSRVGNVDKKILEISEKFDNKISETEQEITQYFDEKLSLVKEETLDITDEARKYFQNLIQENRNGLLSEIRKIKNEKPVEYILESKKGEPIVKDWDSIEKDWNKKIHDKFENYKTDLRKYVAVYASGGGTNATQYQNGGTMYGDLTIIGKLSAGEYLGIRTDYLPLSGGTITGDVTVTGGLSADRIYTTQLDALSANITVIDIKQYELSGFNVTGDVTINGTVSAGNLSAGEIYSNGNRVATVVDPVRTTVTGNGTLSTFPISGASGLVNPSALIVAIDGVLQEPSVDYTVAGGNITFTSPLPSGSKAVVISPTNSLQVSQNIPADGSVTSAKLDNSINFATRPTTSDAGTPAATSLITKADGDKVFFPIEGLFANAYKVPLTNSNGGASGLAAFAFSAASDLTSTFTASGVSGNYATWGSSFTRCQDSGARLVLPNGIGLCAKININTSGLRRVKLLMGGLSAPSVLGAGVLDARGFGVEIEPNPTTTSQIRFRVIYRNQSSQTILGTWTSYYSSVLPHRFQIWTYRQDGELRAVFRSVNFNSITFTNWVVIPPVTITSGDNFITESTRPKTFQIAAEGSGLFYGELVEVFETHNMFPNL